MKKIIKTLIALIIFVFVIVLALPFFLDVNDYKKDIEALIHEKTGRNFQINGDLNLKLLPNISISVNDLVLKEGKGTDKNLLSVDDFRLKLKLKPLIRGEIQIDEFVFVRPVINLEKYNNGKNNWSISVSDKKNQSEENVKEPEITNIQEQKESDNSNKFGDAIKVEKLSVVNAKLSYADKENNTRVVIEDLNLNTSIGSALNSFKITSLVTASQIDKKREKLVLSGSYLYEGSKVDLKDVNVNFGDISAFLNSSYTYRSDKPDTIDLSLKFGEINLDPYLVKHIEEDRIKSKIDKAVSGKSIETSKEVAKEQMFQWNEDKIDLSVLKDFNGHLSVSTKGIKFDKYYIDKTDISAFIRNNKLDIDVKDISLYDGQIKSKIGIDNSISKTKYKLGFEFKDINFQKLPKDNNLLDRIEGKINLSGNLNSIGGNQKQIISNLNGNLNINILQGEIRGINLNNMAKNVAEAFKIYDGIESSTVFNSIKGDFTFRDGIISNNNFLLDSNGIDFRGAGTIDLPQLLINYRVTPESTGGGSLGAIDDIALLPVLIRGYLLKPSYRVEVESAINTLIKNPQSAEKIVDQLKKGVETLKEDNLKKPENILNPDKIKDIINLF